MRDPKRLATVLGAVLLAWEKYPDLRLGQLLLNLAHGERNLYRVEDEELVRRLKTLYFGSES
jgi:hypothetical protein